MNKKFKEGFLSFKKRNRLTFYLLCGVIFILVLFGLYKVGAMSIMGIKEEPKREVPQ